MIDLDLTADRALYDGLLIHIKPLINRLNFRIYIRNPLLEDIKGELTDVWPLTQRAVNQVLAAGASVRFPTTRLAISPFISGGDGKTGRQQARSAGLFYRNRHISPVEK